MRNFEKNEKTGFRGYESTNPRTNKPVQGERRDQRRAKQQQRNFWN